MFINIQQINYTPDKRLIDHLHLKLKQLEKIDERITECHLVLRRENDDKKKGHVVEINLYTAGSHLFTKSNMTDFYVSADDAIDEMRKQLIKLRKKASGN